VSTSSTSLSGFSTAEFGKILRCVCCETAWTVRKTAPQKKKHIQGCAKKLGMTDDTVAHLVRAELKRVADAPPDVPSKVKSVESAVPEAPQPGTLLEELIVGGAKKKSGRRPQVVETVKELHETRQGILDRARQLLSSSKVATPAVEGQVEAGSSSYSPPRTQPFGESRLAHQFRPETEVNRTVIAEYVPSPSTVARTHRSPLPRQQDEDEWRDGFPPSTQPFGESALAKRYGKTPTHATDDLETDRTQPESLPRTQPFGESALGRKFGKTRATLMDLLDGDHPEPVLSLVPSSPPRGHPVFNEMSNSSPERPTHAVPNYSGSDIELMDSPPFVCNPVSPPLCCVAGLRSRM
jgi:hypothetical protein